MGFTIRDFVSVVKENLNSVSLDDNISSEHIYWVAVNIAKFILKRENKTVFKNTSLFEKLCIPMKQVSAIDCGIDFECKKISRSVKPLPDGFLTNFGTLIVIYNLTRDKDYKEVSMTSYKNISKQKYKSRNTGYFWIENNYLYVPNSEVEELNALGLFTDPEQVANFKGDTCYSLLDSKFPCPDYLYSTITELTTNQLLARKKIPQDEDGNLQKN